VFVLNIVELVHVTMQFVRFSFTFWIKYVVI
jgi:hypothetical protein